MVSDLKMNVQTSPHAKHVGLRGIALFEAGKGLGAVVVAAWMLTLLHKDLTSVATELLHFLHRVLHTSPDGHMAREVMRAAGKVTHQNLVLFATLVFGYACIRFVEAVGLWLEKSWAEWFAFISGGLYVPLEVYEVTRHATPVKWCILGINLLIVLYLAWFLQDSHRQRKLAREARQPRPSASPEVLQGH